MITYITYYLYLLKEIYNLIKKMLHVQQCSSRKHQSATVTWSEKKQQQKKGYSSFDIEHRYDKTQELIGMTWIITFHFQLPGR